MKKWLVFALCAAMTLSLAACGADQEPDPEPVPPAVDPSAEVPDSSVNAETDSEEADAETADASGEASDEPQAQLANPFVDCETLEEAQTLSGVELTAPEAIGDSTDRLFRAMEGELLEIQYKNGGEPAALVRKALGTEDVSGDSTVYAQTASAAVGDREVTLKGENDMFQLAIWNDGTYTYSVKLAEGLDSEGFSGLISEIQ